MARPFFVPPTDEDIVEYYRILDQLLSDLMDILNVIFSGRRRLTDPIIRQRVPIFWRSANAAEVRWSGNPTGGAPRVLGHPSGLPDVVGDALRAAHRRQHDERLARSVDKLSTCYYDVSLQLHLLAENFRSRLQQEAEKAREPVGGGVGGVGGLGGASLLGRLVVPQYGRPVCWTVIALYVGWRIICSR